MLVLFAFSCVLTFLLYFHLPCVLCAPRLDLDSDDAPLADLFARAKILNEKHGAKIEGAPSV